jgi:hypothetical protein
MKRTPLSRKTPLRAKSPMRKRKAGGRRALAVRDASWLDNVRSLPACVRCGAGHVEAAHRDLGKGMGLKTDDVATAALCSGCHHELGNGNRLDRDTRRSEMDRCIVETLIALARAGKVLAA